MLFLSSEVKNMGNKIFVDFVKQNNSVAFFSRVCYMILKKRYLCPPIGIMKKIIAKVNSPIYVLSSICCIYYSAVIRISHTLTLISGATRPYLTA